MYVRFSTQLFSNLLLIIIPTIELYNQNEIALKLTNIQDQLDKALTDDASKILAQNSQILNLKQTLKEVVIFTRESQMAIKANGGDTDTRQWNL